MSIEPRLRTILLLGLVATLGGCPTAERGGQPKWDERVPPKVATREASIPRATPAPRGGTAALSLSNTRGRPGEVVSVMAKLSTGGATIAGTQNDIVFDPKMLSVAATAKGKPDCSPNRGLGKEGTAFNFLPSGCRPGVNCTTVRALVLSLTNVGAIGDGSVLYTCKVKISPQAAAGAYQLSVERVGFSDPAGKAIDGRAVAGTTTVER